MDKRKQTGSCTSWLWPASFTQTGWLNDYRTRTIISRGLYIFTPSFTAVYNQERLILQTIYLLNKIKRTRAIISRGLYSFTPFFTAVSNQERVIMARVRYSISFIKKNFFPLNYHVWLNLPLHARPWFSTSFQYSFPFNRLYA